MTRTETEIAEAIKREAESDPPLTQEQRNKLAMLLQGGGSNVAA